MTTRFKHGRFLAAAAFSIGLAASVQAQAASCADVLNSTADLRSFASLVQESGLHAHLSSAQVTVFAPTNTAISHIDTLTRMLAGQNANASPDFPKLQTLVRAHTVDGVHPEDQMRGKVDLTTEAGTGIAIDGTTQRGIMLTANQRNVNLSGFRTIPDVHVAGPAVACDNGLVYPIDNALVQ